MRYWKSTLVSIFVLLCVLICATIVFFWNGDSCPKATFQCSTDENICVPQKYICNSYNDCRNGQDEDPVLCYDLHGSTIMLNHWMNRSFMTEYEYNQSLNACELTNYPSNCECKFYTRLYCKNINLTDIPQDISTNVTHLILANNSIVSLKANVFSKYKLTVVHLEGNGLIEISPRVFAQQQTLEKLLLMHNNLKILDKSVFSGLTKLYWLFLDNNKLIDINLDDFDELKSLQWINLSNNKLTLKNVCFPLMNTLLELDLNSNLIGDVTECTFSKLNSLNFLSLRSNIIEYIDVDAFGTLRNLRELDLRNNLLVKLSSSSFNSLESLERLYLGHNPFHNIPSSLFTKLNILASLNLEDIEIDNIDLKMFSLLTKLESVYFKKYNYCAFVPYIKVCRPLSDGISSMKHLLVKPLLRYSIWIICLITMMGNCLVICSRYIFRDENKALSIVIKNLAASDLLMGFYLFIIGIQDLNFRNIYNNFAYAWMSSFMCTAIGIIAMVSSEVSILIMIFMSVERFYRITMPFGPHFKLTVYKTILILTSIWIVGIGIAIIPAIFYRSSTMFYGTNGLCFPLHINEPYFLGWQFSAFIICGINGVGLLIISWAYYRMFISILSTRKATTLAKRDYDFTIKFFFIVLANATCWFPIIVAKILAFTHFEITNDLYAWMVIFILPVNSAINPLLYTFTTSKFRNQIYQENIYKWIRNLFGSKSFRGKLNRHSSGETDSVNVTSKIASNSYNVKHFLNNTTL